MVELRAIEGGGQPEPKPQGIDVWPLNAIDAEALYERQLERVNEIAATMVKLEAEMRSLPPEARIDAVAVNMVDRHTLQEDPDHDPRQLSLLDAAGMALRSFLSSQELDAAYGKGIDQKYPATPPDMQQPTNIRHAA